jgi:hypothetical protein
MITIYGWRTKPGSTELSQGALSLGWWRLRSTPAANSTVKIVHPRHQLFDPVRETS